MASHALTKADQAELAGEQRGAKALELHRAERSAEIAGRYADEAKQLQAIDETASIWGKSKWSTVDKLAPADLKNVAKAVIQAFPDFGALEITKYFDLLGGKLRENAEFWLHAAAAHPDYDGHELETLEPGTSEWAEFIAVEDPSVIAAAVRCAVWRKDRRLPFVDASYVRANDDMLFDYNWVELEAGNRKDALAEAPEGYDKIGLYDSQGGGPKVWKARIKQLKPDWQALALKKARTTATRRAVRKAFSFTEAKIVALQGQVNRLLEDRQLRGQDGHEAVAHEVEGVAGGLRVRAGQRERCTPIRIPDDPYAPDPAPADASPETIVDAEVVDESSAGAPVPGTPEAQRGIPDANQAMPDAPASDTRYISEADRRRMFTWLNDRDLRGQSAHELLKLLIATVQQRDVSEVSTKQVTYAEYAAIREAVEALPVRADQATESPS